jgi:hypothetical protein
VASLAHQFALAQPLITADVVSAREFQAYSSRFAVQAVPKAVVNRRHEIVGGMPEPMFVAEVLRAVGIDPDNEARA